MLNFGFEQALAICVNASSTLWACLALVSKYPSRVWDEDSGVIAIYLDMASTAVLCFG